MAACCWVSKYLFISGNIFTCCVSSFIPWWSEKRHGNVLFHCDTVYWRLCHYQLAGCKIIYTLTPSWYMEKKQGRTHISDPVVQAWKRYASSLHMSLATSYLSITNYRQDWNVKCGRWVLNKEQPTALWLRNMFLKAFDVWILILSIVLKPKIHFKRIDIKSYWVKLVTHKKINISYSSLYIEAN